MYSVNNLDVVHFYLHSCRETESNSSRIKESGEINKKKFEGSNIYQLCHWVPRAKNIETHYVPYQRKHSMGRSYLKWQWLQCWKGWTREFWGILDCQFCLEQCNSTSCSCSFILFWVFNFHMWDISIYFDTSFPHLCCIWNKLHLHPYWNVKSHPLFIKGLETLGSKHSIYHDCVMVECVAGSSLMEQYLKHHPGTPTQLDACRLFTCVLHTVHVHNFSHMFLKCQHDVLLVCCGTWA